MMPRGNAEPAMFTFGTLIAKSVFLDHSKKYILIRMIIIYNYIVSDYCTHHAKASNRVERMTTRFIGPADRLTLAKKPQRAIHCWQDEFNSGQSFFKQAMWTMALPHAGRAFEIAEILLGSDTVESANGRELFTASASLLIDTLGKLGEPQLIQSVHWRALQGLTQDLHLQPKAGVEVAKHLERLYQLVSLQAASKILWMKTLPDTLRPSISRSVSDSR